MIRRKTPLPKGEMSLSGLRAFNREPGGCCRIRTPATVASLSYWRIASRAQFCSLQIARMLRSGLGGRDIPKASQYTTILLLLAPDAREDVQIVGKGHSPATSRANYKPCHFERQSKRDGLRKPYGCQSSLTLHEVSNCGPPQSDFPSRCAVNRTACAARQPPHSRRGIHTPVLSSLSDQSNGVKIHESSSAQQCLRM